MNRYTLITSYYDLLMTDGYYDYDALGDTLADLLEDAGSVLELGVGTGLMAEKLLARRPGCAFTGIDYTASMLELAKVRVGDQARLLFADVTDMDLGETYDAIFSCGGVWYVIGAGDERQLCTHIPDEGRNYRALTNVLSHLRPGGLFLLSEQGVHTDYDKPLPGGVTYRQRISWNGDHFRKEYVFEDGDGRVSQFCNYRIYRQSEMERLLEQVGLDPLPAGPGAQFHAYRKQPVAVPVEPWQGVLAGVS